MEGTGLSIGGHGREAERSVGTARGGGREFGSVGTSSLHNPLQVVKEAGIGNADAFRSMNASFTFRT